MVVAFPQDQREDFITMMPVEINQWRATIGCFRVSIQNSSPLKKSVKPLSILFQILKLFWFCYCFIAISIFVLPLTLTIQFLAVHSVTNQSCFLPLFARVHHLAKAVLYTSLELFKRVPFGIIGLVRYKHAAVRQLLFLYAYFYIGCRTCYVLHTQWLVFSDTLTMWLCRNQPRP